MEHPVRCAIPPTRHSASRVLSAVAFAWLGILSAACGGNDSNPTGPTPPATRIINVSGNLAFGEVPIKMYLQSRRRDDQRDDLGAGEDTAAEQAALTAEFGDAARLFHSPFFIQG